MKLMLGALTILMLLSSASCADEFMIARTQRNVARLRSYRGTLTETGLLASGDVRSEVLYARPNRFVERVLAPASFAGVTIAYDGQTLTAYYPRANYAVRFEHLTAPSAEDTRSLIASAYRHNVATYDYDLGDDRHVAGLPVVTLEYRAKRKQAFTPKGEMQVYDRFSFPVSGYMNFKDKAHYLFHFDEITFNRELDDQLFELALPKNVILTRWDMSSPNVSEAEMREQANFEFRLPSVLPSHLARERAVRVDGPVPAFTVVYRHGPQFAFVSMFKDTGLRPTVEEIGVPVEVGGSRGRLLVSPTISSYTFTQDGTMYILTSNLPFDEMLNIAQSIGSASSVQQATEAGGQPLDPYPTSTSSQ